MNIGFSPSVEKIYDRIHCDHLHALADWCVRTVQAAPAGSPGYRDLYWSETSQSFEWYFPNSNAAERIEAFLWLGRKLGRTDTVAAALRYAECMLRSERGLGQNTGTGADGMVWYWRDSGTYMTNYTMRVPPAFFEAARFFNRPDFQQAALLAGDGLLSQQQSSGMFESGWYHEAHSDITTGSINSRIGYAAWTLASLYKETGDEKWRVALARFLESFLRYQNADGSFPSQVYARHDQRIEIPPKGHYTSYIMYGLARASLTLPDDEALRAAAVACGAYCLRQYAVLGANIYGNLEESGDSEKVVWHSATPDFAAGYAWMYQLTGQPAYQQAAARTLIAAFGQQADETWPLSTQGAIPLWVDQGDRVTAAFGGFYNFWTVLAAQGLDENFTH